MKKLILPLLIASTMGLSACCECEVPKSKYQDDSAMKENRSHHGRHGHHNRNGRHADRNKKQGEYSKHSQHDDIHGTEKLSALTLPEGAIMLGDNTSGNASWSYEQLSVGKGLLNFFDGSDISTVAGNLTHHRYARGEALESFSQADFEQSAKDYMQEIGAVEFFNDSIPETTADKLQNMPGFSSVDYTGLDPTKYRLSQYMSNTDGKQVIYQIVSDDSHGEIGAFLVGTEELVLPIGVGQLKSAPQPAGAELAVSEVTQSINDNSMKPTEAILLETETAEATNATENSEEVISESSEQKVVEADDSKLVAKPNVQAKINIAPVEETMKDVAEMADLEGRSRDESVQTSKETDGTVETKTESAEVISSESMQSQLGDSGAITLNINFDTSKATIRNDNMYIIDELNKLLRQYPDLKFIIKGHTDDVGEADMNQRLSLARAKEVKAELEKKGIESHRLKTEGYGESMPIVDNNSDDNRARNRRVELIQF